MHEIQLTQKVTAARMPKFEIFEIKRPVDLAGNPTSSIIFVVKRCSKMCNDECCRPMVLPASYQPVVDKRNPCRPQRVMGRPDNAVLDKKRILLVRQILAALTGVRAAEYAGGKLKKLTRAVVQMVTKKTAYHLYTYFCNDPNPSESISKMLKLKVVRWGFQLEEFHIKVRHLLYLPSRHRI